MKKTYKSVGLAAGFGVFLCAAVVFSMPQSAKTDFEPQLPTRIVTLGQQMHSCEGQAKNSAVGRAGCNTERRGSSAKFVSITQ